MSALYRTLVTHTRLRPRHHHLRYAVSYLLLDLAHLPRLRLLARGRFGLFSLRLQDYGDGSGDLLAYVRGELAKANLSAAGASVSLLTVPRFLGYAFNPLSLYFCRAADGRLGAILYEVNNTFGQRHSYLVPVVAGAQGGLIRQSCAKAFFVSPFMEMGLRYRFSVHPPGDSLGLHIAVEDESGVVLRATMAGRRTALTDATLLRMACTMPFLGFKIIGAIHWEALKLWLKGVRLRRRPPPPPQAVTLAASETEYAS